MRGQRLRFVEQLDANRNPPLARSLLTDYRH